VEEALEEGERRSTVWWQRRKWAISFLTVEARVEGRRLVMRGEMMILSVKG
jgi:hypothetical protein